MKWRLAESGRNVETWRTVQKSDKNPITKEQSEIDEQAKLVNSQSEWALVSGLENPIRRAKNWPKEPTQPTEIVFGRRMSVIEAKKETRWRYSPLQS